MPPTLTEIRDQRSSELAGQPITSRAEPEFKRKFKQGVNDTRENIDDDALRDAIERAAVAEILSLIDFGQLEQSLTRLQPVIRDLHTKGMKQTVEDLRKFNQEVSHLPNSAVAERWVERKTVEFSQQVSQETQKAVREAVQRGITLGLSVDQIEREVKQSIGLTRRKQRAVNNFRRMLENGNPEATGRFLNGAEQQRASKIVENGADDEEIEELTLAYADHQLNLRSEAVAVEETRNAFNFGKLNQAKAAAIFNEVALTTLKKIWLTQRDSSVCQFCRPLHGEVLAINKQYESNVERKRSSGFRTMSGLVPPLHVNCFSEDTEVYTNEGWKRFPELNGNEKILSMNPDNKDIDFLDYVDEVSYQYDGKMISFHSNSYDQLVTPDHNMYVETEWYEDGVKKTNRKLQKAKELKDRYEFNLPRTGNWNGNDKSNISINEQQISLDDYAVFMGYYLSEGSVTERENKHYQISIHQKEENKNKIYEDIKSLPYQVSNGAKNKIYISGEGLGEHLQQFGKSHEKYVPKEIKSANSEVIKKFLKAYLYGDGSVSTSSWEKKSLESKPDRSFCTSSKKMSSDLGELIFKVGDYPSFRKENEKGKKQVHSNGVYYGNHDLYQISWNRSNNSRFGKKRDHGIKINEVDYSGKVYDVELEKWHVLLVRRDGKTAWSGNCRCEVQIVVQ